MGYYVLGHATDKYIVKAWFPTKEEANKECKRLIDFGLWSHMPPKVEPDEKERG